MNGASMPRRDLDAIVALVGQDWESLRGQRVLVTGGTGIIGKWLLSSLIHANRTLGLGCSATVLTRDAAAFRMAHSGITGATEVTLLEGDVRDFALATDVPHSHVIHAATDVVAKASAASVLDTCVAGTRHVIDRARGVGATRMLLLSSGAVYGKTPPSMARIPEDYNGAPDCQSSAAAYAEGKRCAELLCAMASEEGDITIPVARCFAMVGPYLPLDKHFAIGNFIGDALRDEPIHINGDGTPLRSYLHAVDVTSWLWALLFRGQGRRAYNVGSESPISIAQLAARVVEVLESTSDIHVLAQPTPGAHSQGYVPATSRIFSELGLIQTVHLDEAIARTAAWYREPDNDKS